MPPQGFAERNRTADAPLGRDVRDMMLTLLCSGEGRGRNCGLGVLYMRPASPVGPDSVSHADLPLSTDRRVKTEERRG